MEGLEQQSRPERTLAQRLNVLRGSAVVRSILAGVLLVGAPDIFRGEQPHTVSVREQCTKEMEEKSSEQKLVEAYAPKLRGDITDLTVDAKKLLLGIPRVVNVERFPATEKQESRIVQIRDWHWISREDFAEDQKLVGELRGLEHDFIEKRESAIVRKMKDGGVLVLGGGHRLEDNVPPNCEYLRVETRAYRESGVVVGEAKTEKEIDARYEEFLQEVEAVQADQRVLLRCLAQHHGLQHIYQEGPHVLFKGLFQDQVRAVREFGDHPLFREERLKIGAGGQLLAEGALREVRAADDLSTMLEGMERKKKEK